MIINRLTYESHGHAVIIAISVGMPAPLAVDIYHCGFPCTPWSLRGGQLGFEDPNSLVVWQTIATIRAVVPKLFILENVANIDAVSASHQTSDFQVIRHEMRQQLPEFRMTSVYGLDPPHFGFPTPRPRVFEMGGHQTCVAGGAIERNVELIRANPAPWITSWRDLFKIDECVGDLGRIDWSALGASLQSDVDACLCSVDATVLCPMHPCQCGCRAAGDLTSCKWRAKADAFIAKHFDESFVKARAGTVTYIRLLELQGRDVPQSPRVRNMLNILAWWSKKDVPGVHPYTLVDISQGIDRLGMRNDGMVPTLAKNTQLWSMFDGVQLSARTHAILHGHNPYAMDLTRVSENQLRQMVGNSVHVACLGGALLALLAAVGTE